MLQAAEKEIQCNLINLLNFNRDVNGCITFALQALLEQTV